MIRKADGWPIQITGFLFFGTLFIFAWVFFKERMLNYDPAFFSFRIICTRDYDVELGRWGSVFSQILPLWFLKAGCSLETFLRMYSVSFILIYYGIFLIITLVLQHAKAAIILMLTLCLAFRHAYYYSTAELYQGLAIAVLVMALLFPETPYQTSRKKNVAYFISAILIYVMSYYHQILIFPLMFIFLYEVISEKKHTDKYLIGMVVLTAIWFVIRIKFLTASTYEKGKIPEFSVLISQLSNVTHLQSFDYFKHFVRHYILSLVVLNVICVAVMLIKRRYILAAFYCLFNAGFIYLNIVTYSKGESIIMYENYLTVLGLFCALPLSILILKSEKPIYSFVVMIFVLVFNLQSVYASHIPYTEKIKYLDRIVSRGRKQAEKKYVISERNLPWNYDWISWSLPFETLLYSSLQTRDSSITVCTASPVNQYDSLRTFKNIFLGPHWAPTWFWTTDLNRKYFNLPHGEYGKLCNKQSDTSFQESVFNNKNITIEPLKSSIVTGKGIYCVLPVKIKNISGARINAIPDIPHAISLSYHILSEDGKVFLFNGSRTFLETDIYDESSMGLVVDATVPPGDYRLVIDFVSENNRWWNIGSEVNLTVK